MSNKEAVTKELVEKVLLEGALLGARKLTVLLDSPNDKISSDAADRLLNKAGFDKKNDTPLGPQININLNSIVDALQTAKEVIHEEKPAIEGTFQVRPEQLRDDTVHVERT